VTTQTIRNGASITVNLQPAETLKIVAVSGNYTLTGIAGSVKDTTIATAATGGSYGPYAAAVSVRIASSASSEIDYDYGTSPSVASDTLVYSNTDPLTGGYALLVNGRIYSLGSSTYTWATLPAAASAPGLMALVTDINGGTFFRSNGVRWKPYNNMAALSVLGSRVTMSGTSEVILAQVAIPAGLVKDYDNLWVRQSLSKTGTTEIATLRLRLGTAGTTADTTIWTNASMAGTSVSIGYDLMFKRNSATTITKTGSGSTMTPLAGASTAAYASAVTVPNMDSSDVVLSLTCTSSNTAETFALEDFVLELVSK